MIARAKSLLANRSILLQLGVVILLCQLLAQGLAIAFVFWRFERPDLLRFTSIQTVEAVMIHRMLARADAMEEATLLGLLARAGSAIAVVPAATLAPPSAGAENPQQLLRGLSAAAPDLAGQSSFVAAAPGTDQPRIALALEGGRAVLFDPRMDSRALSLPGVVTTLQISLALVSLGLISLWALRMITAPVQRLATSAERFAIDLDPTPMPETGPAEMRKLAHAFNTMRDRIRQLVESRSRMLAAVSHDLRTPLTRMRLRVETGEDGDEKERMLKDIGAMDRMIGQALSYLRDQASAAQPERVDLCWLVKTVCDDFADIGRDVTFTGARNIVLVCEPDLLTRALSNLVDNALKFGTRAAVSVAMRSAAEAVIHIRDNGPGIADDDKRLAFEPFSRGDKARGASGADGFGLGLAIARQIIERLGGSITLHDNAPQGLDVQVVLPIQAGIAAAPAGKQRAEAA